MRSDEEVKLGMGIAEGVGGDAGIGRGWVRLSSKLSVWMVISDLRRGKGWCGGAVFVPFSGKDEEVAAVEVTDGVELDVLEAGAIVGGWNWFEGDGAI